MAWVAGAILVSGYLASEAQKDSAEAQTSAAESGMAAQERMASEQIALQREALDLQRPWYEAGSNYLAQLQQIGEPGGMEAFYASPEYQLSLGSREVSQNALEQQFAARGKIYSSDYANALAGQQAAQDVSAYQNYLARLSSGAGLGYQAAGGMAGTYGQMGQTYGALGNALAGGYSNIGQARASAYQGQSDIYQNMIGQAMYGYGSGMWGNQQPTQTQGTGYQAGTVNPQGGAENFLASSSF